MAEHNTLTGASVHECKQITSATLSDSGKVITPSGNGVGTLRQLTEGEITDKYTYHTVYLHDVSTNSNFYFPLMYIGTFVGWYAAIDGTVAGLGLSLIPKINGTEVADGRIIFSADDPAGTTVGDTNLTDTNFNIGDYFQITVSVAPSSAINATVVLETIRDAS